MFRICAIFPGVVTFSLRFKKKTQTTYEISHPQDQSYLSLPNMTKSKPRQKGQKVQVPQHPESTPTSSTDTTTAPPTATTNQARRDLTATDHGEKSQKSQSADMKKGKGKEKAEPVKEEEGGEEMKQSKQPSKRATKKAENIAKSEGGWSISDLQPRTLAQQGYVNWLKDVATHLPGSKTVSFVSAIAHGNFEMEGDRISGVTKEELDDTFVKIFGHLVGFGVNMFVRDNSVAEINEKTGRPWKNIHSFIVVKGEAVKCPPPVGEMKYRKIQAPEPDYRFY